MIEAKTSAKLDYVAVVDAESLAAIESLERGSACACCARSSFRRDKAHR